MADWGSEDDRPRRPVRHEIGQVLDALSVDDLSERILLLESEIERLEAARAAKEAARNEAGSIFTTR